MIKVIKAWHSYANLLNILEEVDEKLFTELFEEWLSQSRSLFSSGHVYRKANVAVKYPASRIRAYLLMRTILRSWF